MNSLFKHFLLRFLAALFICSLAIDPATAYALARPIPLGTNSSSPFKEEALQAPLNWSQRSIFSRIGWARVYVSAFVLGGVVSLGTISIAENPKAHAGYGPGKFSLRRLFSHDEARNEKRLREQIEAAAQRVESHIKRDRWLGKEGERLLPILQENFTNPQKRDYLLLNRDWHDLENSLIFADDNFVIYKDQIRHAKPEELETFIVGLAVNLQPEQHSRWETIANLYRYESDNGRSPQNWSAPNTKRILGMWIKNGLDVKKMQFAYVQELAQSAHANVYDYIKKRAKDKDSDMLSFEVDNATGEINENLTRLRLLNNLFRYINHLKERVFAIALTEQIDTESILDRNGWCLRWLTDRNNTEPLGPPSELEPPRRPVPRPPSNPDPSTLLRWILASLGVAGMATAGQKVESDPSDKELLCFLNDPNINVMDLATAGFGSNQWAWVLEGRKLFSGNQFHSLEEFQRAAWTLYRSTHGITFKVFNKYYFQPLMQHLRTGDRRVTNTAVWFAALALLKSDVITLQILEEMIGSSWEYPSEKSRKQTANALWERRATLNNFPSILFDIGGMMENSHFHRFVAFTTHLYQEADQRLHDGSLTVDLPKSPDDVVALPNHLRVNAKILADTNRPEPVTRVPPAPSISLEAIEPAPITGNQHSFPITTQPPSASAVVLSTLQNLREHPFDGDQWMALSKAFGSLGDQESALLAIFGFISSEFKERQHWVSLWEQFAGLGIIDKDHERVTDIFLGILNKAPKDEESFLAAWNKIRAGVTHFLLPTLTDPPHLVEALQVRWEKPHFPVGQSQEIEALKRAS